MLNRYYVKVIQLAHTKNYMTPVYNYYYKPSFSISAFRLGGGTSVQSSFGRLLTIETANTEIAV